MTQSDPAASVGRRMSAVRADKPGGLSPRASTSPAPRVLHAPSASSATFATVATASAAAADTGGGAAPRWAGYLQKRSDWLKHWETYFFVLRGRSLYCYLSEEDFRRQPEKSKIKKGKFGFADRVTLTRAWDVDESPALSPREGDAAADPSAPALGAPSAFRFTLETDKGHQLHFRTNSEASKLVWLQFAALIVTDADAGAGLSPSLVLSPDASLSVPPLLPLLDAPIADFYRGYEYLYAALSDRVTSDAVAAYNSSIGTSVADGAGPLLSPGVADAPDRGSFGPSSASAKKPLTTFRAVAPGQPLALARFFSLLSADVILRSNYLPMVPFEGTFRGFAGVLEFFTRVSQSVCFEQFVVERVEEERVEDQDDEQQRTSRVVVVAGRETMLVRFNQTAFVQQWTHKLHVKRADGRLRVTRWEVFGDVVASSVVFKAPGSATSLVLPSLSERIRESFVGGHIVSLTLLHVADVRPKDAHGDRFFVRCSLDTNEFDGVWHTEAQSRAAEAVPGDDALTFVYNQELHLQFDRLSRDDNTILLIEFCRESSREVLARTHVNLASFLNVKPPPPSGWRRVRSRRHHKGSKHGTSEPHSYVLASDRQSFLGKLVLALSISSLSAAGQRQQQRSSRHSLSRSSRHSSFCSDSELALEASGVSEYGDDAPVTPSSRASGGGLRALASSAARLASLSSASSSSHQPVEAEPEEMMHQFVINGVRYQLAEKYRMVKIVGKGTYGEVIAASDFVHGGTFAIKKLGQFLRHPKVAMLALREIKLMNGIGAHPCLMGVHELQRPLDYEHFEDLYIIQPLMETDLCRIIHSKELLSDDQVQYFMYQMICGLHYLHSADVLHRDLKPSNILVNSDCRVKICDFGLARHADDRDLADGLSEYVVTRWYRAPELLLANMYTKAVDLWSLGCIFAELLGRRILFPGTSYVDQLKVIVDVVGTPTTFSFQDNPAARRFAGRQFLIQCDKVPKVDWRALFPDANPDGLDLLDKLLQFDPAQRISAAEALQHPYVSAWRDPRMEQPCAPDVAAALTQFDYAQVANDPPTLKRLLFEEVQRTHALRRQQQQQQR